MTDDRPLTPLQRDLLAHLARTQAGGTKRPDWPVTIGRPDDEPRKEPGGPVRGAVKIK
jgi:hypothetical protein